MAFDRDRRNMESDSEFENRIRPQELDNFRGQEKVAENLLRLIADRECDATFEFAPQIEERASVLPTVSAAQSNNQ